MERTYIAIDLKSFYASVECVERNLDPLDVNLLVADLSRGDGTICLAVSPALKSFGVPGRPRLFEARQKVAEINSARHIQARRQSRPSRSASALKADLSLMVDFYIAKPRMSLYIDYSCRIYGIYLEFVDAADIHVYSVDEVFIDATPYLRAYGMSAERMAMTIVRRIIERTGITATAGIGSNLYLAKVAMDIKAKHIDADANGVRVSRLDEASYRRELWPHRPLTDFWRLGSGTAARLERLGLYTMGDIARFALTSESVLYREFGINAELLIDHAWGREPVTIADIKAYKPASRSMQSGQVLPAPYSTAKARNVLCEMADALCIDLVSAELATDRVAVYVGYELRGGRSGRHNASRAAMPLGMLTSSCRVITEVALKLFDSIVDRGQMVRRLGICACRVTEQPDLPPEPGEGLQLSLFDDAQSQLATWSEIRRQQIRELSQQRAVAGIKKRYGKNAILRAVSFSDGATQRERNCQIGGHSA